MGYGVQEQDLRIMITNTAMYIARLLLDTLLHCFSAQIVRLSNKD